MSRVSPITAASFGHDVMYSPIPVVVDFYADWCGPCKVLAPVLEQLAERYDGRVKFVKVNVEREQELAAHFQASSIPTLMTFNNGELVSRTAGLPDFRAFMGQLDRLIPNPVSRAS